MIQNFASSHARIASVLNQRGLDVLSPEDASYEPLLRTAVNAGDGLTPLIAHVFPSVRGYWALARHEQNVAEVIPAAGEYIVVVYTHAVEQLDGIRQKLAAAQWIESKLYPRLFPHTPAPPLDLAELYALLPVMGLATLIGHEVGHAVDAFDVPVTGDDAHSVWLAEEVSADGHAMRVGVALAVAWAMDQNQQSQAPKADALRVAVVLMLLSNAVFDDINPSQEWTPRPGVEHPVGTQRLLGTAVALMNLLPTFGENGEIAVDALLGAYSALVTAGRCRAEEDEDLIDLLNKSLDKHKPLLKGQYTSLKAILKRRSKIKPSAGRGRP